LNRALVPCGTKKEKKGLAVINFLKELLKRKQLNYENYEC